MERTDTKNQQLSERTSQAEERLREATQQNEDIEAKLRRAESEAIDAKR